MTDRFNPVMTKGNIDYLTHCMFAHPHGSTESYLVNTRKRAV